MWEAIEKKAEFIHTALNSDFIVPKNPFGEGGEGIVQTTVPGIDKKPLAVIKTPEDAEKVLKDRGGFIPKSYSARKKKS
jgi:hypothetical protein